MSVALLDKRPGVTAVYEIDLTNVIGSATVSTVDSVVSTSRDYISGSSNVTISAETPDADNTGAQFQIAGGTDGEAYDLVATATLTSGEQVSGEAVLTVRDPIGGAAFIDTAGSDRTSYITLDEADTYWAARNDATWNAAETAEKEAALLEASAFLDAVYGGRWVGDLRSNTQRLDWPRSAAFDREGRVLNTIPNVVKDATAELAKLALSEALIPAVARGGQVKREWLDGVGGKEYFDTAISHRSFRFVDLMLTPVLRFGQNRLARA